MCSSDLDPDVIALLEELDKRRHYIGRLEQENVEMALTLEKLRVEMKAAKSKLNEQREYYEGVISDGSKRIAALLCKDNLVSTTNIEGERR